MDTVVLIDNYDSFTFNLYQLLLTVPAAVRPAVRVFRNDAISLAELAALEPDAIVISPGPGQPSDAGISLKAIELALTKSIPLLGVCLGHQALAEVLGAAIVRAPVPLHGYTSQIEHCKQDIFLTVPSPCEVMRYHSLVVKSDALPSELLVTATCPEDNTIMGIKVTGRPARGVQFHPESFRTTAGARILENFLTISLHADHPSTNAA